MCGHKWIKHHCDSTTLGLGRSEKSRRTINRFTSSAFKIEFINITTNSKAKSGLRFVTVITSALTSEVHGDGDKVVALSYLDRQSEETHRVELEGIFVQIGLIPNTEWLKGVVDLSPRGEIEVDGRGQTSVPGVFAAGDATTVPFKQIIIAAGDGSKAALSAFDYLIRLAPVEVQRAAE